MYMSIRSHVLKRDIFCNHTAQMHKVPVPRETGRRLLFAWSSAQAVKRASTCHHEQWREQLLSTPWMPVCSEACVLQPRVTLPTGIPALHDAFPDSDSKLSTLNSTGELSQEEGKPEEKNENNIFPLPKKTVLLPDP